MEDLPNSPDGGDLLELAAVALQGMLLPFGQGKEQTWPSGPGRTRPVVLVHGWGGNGNQLLALKYYLRLLGFNRLFSFNYDSRPDMTSPPLNTQARELRSFLSLVAKRCHSQRDSLDLVTYCLGGLIARIALQNKNLRVKVDRCITIACPHLGSDSPFWRPTGLAEKLNPQGGFMDQLNHPANRAPAVRYSSLWADRDMLIQPVQNGIYQEGDQLAAHGVGHQGILLHPGILSGVAQRLGAGQELPRGILVPAQEGIKALAGRLLRKVKGLRAKQTDQITIQNDPSK